MAKKRKLTGIEKAALIAGKIFYWFIFWCLIITAGGIAISTLNLPRGFKVFSVVSGSMEPKIHVGSIVFVQKEDSYKTGDVITFSPQGAKKGDTVTHRIYGVKDQNGATLFETKGDANNAPDSELIPASSVIGKEVFSIPLLGYPISYAKTEQGLVLLIILPATIIIYSELISVKNEALKLIRERKKKLSLAEKIELGIGVEEIKTERWYRRLFRRK